MSQPAEHHLLQALFWPEQGISTERDLYFRLDKAAWFSDDVNAIFFEEEGLASFDTAFNLFNSGKWRRSCKLENLQLRLRGQGRFELIVFQAMPEDSYERLVNRVVTLDSEALIDLSHFFDFPRGSVIFFTLRALSEGRLDGASWETQQPPIRSPKLALSITTFRREKEVRSSVKRFEAFIKTSPLADHLHLFVVDNGQTAELTPSTHVTPILNENLGGSGGFARGLLEAEAQGFSHCLFMDDDATVHMGAFERVWAFLAYAENDKTAISGGLTMANHRWCLWESGAVFNQVCRPLWIGTDLRDFQQAFKMETESTGRNPFGYYGAWWFFAFPIKHAQYRPFPFFVRGDDISFSLANAFDIVTLPGAVCFQDEDFSDKESAQTLYLDLRSHLLHHLSLPRMEISRAAALKIPLGFYMRNLLVMHYESLDALNLSFEDVLRGPAFFAANADMAERRALIGKIRKTEAWSPTEYLPAERRRFDPRQHNWRGKILRQIMKYSLNGHFLPFFGLWGNHVTIRASERNLRHNLWGASQITYVNAAGDQTYTVRHSKRAALRQLMRLAKNLISLYRRYPELQAEWRKGYVELASNDFWKKQFKL